MKNRNWFWGLFFLFAAIFVIASQIGAFGQVGVFSIFATVLLAAIFIRSIIDRNYFGVFISLAFLYMIYWQPLMLVFISPWLLIFAAVLISIAFHFLFHSHSGKSGCSYDVLSSHSGMGQYNTTTESMDDNNPFAKVNFGASSKYLHSDCLKSGRFISSFGALEVFFDQAQLSPDGAEIFLDVSFGSIKLYIPKYWRVLDNVHVMLGDVENDTRLAQPTENAPRLTLSGNVQLGSVEIQYI